MCRYPAATLSTKIEFAHVYVCSHRILDILLAIDHFESLRQDFIPFLAKAQWQHNLIAEHTSGASSVSP